MSGFGDLLPFLHVTYWTLVSIHDIKSFEQYFAPTCWLYEKGTDLIHERCVMKRTDFPLEMVSNASHQWKEIPQATYNVTYMTVPSATWESKAKKMRRKGGSYTIFEKKCGDALYG